MNMEEMEAVEIAYLRRTGPYGPENRQLMERLKVFLKERGRMGSGTVLLGTPAGSGADGMPSLRSLIRSGRSPGSGKIWSA